MLTKNTGSVEAAAGRKEKELAHACGTTILTEPDPCLHRNGVLSFAVRKVYRRRRYFDLLSIPGLRRLPARPDLLEQLEEDIALTIGLHGVENLLVVTANASHEPIVRLLCEHPNLKRKLRSIDGYTARPRVQDYLRTLVITCVDYRLHAEDGVMRRTRDTLGARADSGHDRKIRFLADGFNSRGADQLGLMTIPGAAKELASDTQRRGLVLFELDSLAARGLKRVILLAHTDCGKYGGDEAFGNDIEAQTIILRNDLSAAARAIAARCSSLEVEASIVFLAENQPAKIERINWLVG